MEKFLNRLNVPSDFGDRAESDVNTSQILINIVWSLTSW